MNEINFNSYKQVKGKYIVSFVWTNPPLLHKHLNSPYSPATNFITVAFSVSACSCYCIILFNIYVQQISDILVVWFSWIRKESAWLVSIKRTHLCGSIWMDSDTNFWSYDMNFLSFLILVFRTFKYYHC